ncbi:uncharacterized protein LOC126611859 [Malus sylvestris]|uniref:uncharacterized protein n=1 Tax=Malus domestica TaxID=3750 RepID=UPI0004992651|nr:uncharacterized protein LOC103416167 [Malus domestica]XP_050136146.1 uncharacterized protein LOC126611859 [Malus sylvestris]
MDLVDVHTKTQTWLNEYKGWHEVKKSSEVPTMHKWQKPVHGWIKCNFDGAWDENRALRRSRVVVRDKNGKFVVVKSVQFSRVCSPMLVEILAICAAMEVGRQLEATCLIFEGDALLVIKALQRDTVANNGPFGHLLHDIHLML